MKKRLKNFVLSVLTVFLMGMTTYTTAYAQENIKLMTIQDNQNNPILFIKGIEDEIESVAAVIGNVAASDVKARPISEEKISMRTLILIDNSLSIPEKNRDSIKNIISELIASRANNEQFSIATFGEKIQVLIDFTDSYVELKSTLEDIEFKDQETYLTDVLYELIKDDNFSKEDGIYNRVFVISDGVDNKSIGYTTEELSSLLKESNIPVYTLGVYNKKQSNASELKNMFALSRQTNAESFLFNELENTMDVVRALSDDQKIIRFEVIPDNISKDGSKKTIMLSIRTSTEEFSVQADNIRMSQEAIKTEKEEIIEESEKETIEVTEPIQETEEKNDNSTTILVILSIVGVVTAVILFVFVMNMAKKKKKENIVKEVEDPFREVEGSSGNTEYIEEDNEKKGDSDTIQLFDDDENDSFTVSLTDLNNSAKSFRKTSYDKVIIGREEEKADIWLSYDRSVSNPHCSIEKRGRKFYLKDLQSSNGTYLDGNRVLSEVEISSGSIIKLGRVKLRVEIR